MFSLLKNKGRNIYSSVYPLKGSFKKDNQLIKGMKWGFLLSQEQLTLARAECKRLHPQSSQWKETTLLQCESETIQPEKLAFTRSAYQIIYQGTPEEVSTWLQTTTQPTTKKIKVEHNNLSQKNISSLNLRKLIIPWLGRPPVDLHHPEEIYTIITDEHEWFITKKVWENKEEFTKRANHHRPAPHPSSLPPKLARAMINLAGPIQHLFDPFCGSGGILLEAELMNISSVGIDNDPEMITRAKINLDSFGKKPLLELGDARTTTKKTEAIITDLPYGKNTKSLELVSVYEEFLINAETLTKIIVMGIPDSVKIQSIIKKTQWQIKEEFIWPHHKTLNKKIYILEIR